MTQVVYTDLINRDSLSAAIKYEAIKTRSHPLGENNQLSTFLNMLWWVTVYYDTFSVSLYFIYQSLYLFPSDQSEHFRSLTFNFNHYSYLKISSFVWHIQSNLFKLNLILSYLILSYFLRQFCSFILQSTLPCFWI